LKRKLNDSGVYAAYREFHGTEPEAIHVSLESLTIPDTLVIIGEVEAIEYRIASSHSKYGKHGEVFRHEWGDTGHRRVKDIYYFCTDESRRRFYLIPANPQSGYPVLTRRGVVG